MRHNATIESAAIEEARRELVQLREARVDRMTKKEAVRRLAKEIRAAKQGCSDEEIVEVLAKHGLAMSVATLKGYLRSGGTGEARKDRSRAGETKGSAREPGPATGSAIAGKAPEAAVGGNPRDSAQRGDPAVAGAAHAEAGASKASGAKPRAP